MLADIISARVVDELLTVLKVRGSYDSLGWVGDSTGFDDLYEQYTDMIDNERAGKSKKTKSSGKDDGKTEAELVGEMASLMTQMGMYLEKEEFEKCVPIKARMREVRKILKEVFNVDFDTDEQ